jgi:hypothetical protein
MDTQWIFNSFIPGAATIFAITFIIAATIILLDKYLSKPRNVFKKDRIFLFVVIGFGIAIQNYFDSFWYGFIAAGSIVTVWIAYAIIFGYFFDRRT